MLADLEAFVKRTTEASGVPLRIVEPSAVDRIVAMLKAGRSNAYAPTRIGRPEGRPTDTMIYSEPNTTFLLKDRDRCGSGRE